MGKIFLALSILFVSGLAHADELDDAYQACLPYKNDISPKMTTLLDGTIVVDASGAHGPLFKPGWEHCLVIHRAWLQRNAVPVVTPSMPLATVVPTDPKYQSTVNLANKLMTPVPPPPGLTLPQ